MQVYIYKNGQQLGPFEKSVVIEMIAKCELTKDDWVFREFDTEWSKAGSLYKTINPTIVKFTLTSGLIIGYQLSSFTPTDVVYFKIPAEKINGDNFKKRYLKDFYEQWFGQNWQAGNEDDSRYQIVDEKIEILSAENLAKAEWRQPDTRLYLIKNGQIEKVELAEFENAPDFVEKITKKFHKPTAENSLQNKTEPVTQTSVEHAILQAIELRLDEKIEPLPFLRKLLEFETWRVPIFNKSDFATDGNLLQPMIFYSENKAENAVYIFSDPQAVADFTNSRGESTEGIFLTLPGINAFDLDFSECDFLCINPYSETSIDYPGDQFELIKTMIGSIKIEKKLRELQSINRDKSLIDELSAYKHYFWVFYSSGEALIMKDALGKTTLPVFTSADYFEMYKKRYCEEFNLDESLLKYELIDGVELGKRILVSEPDKVMFNIFSGYVVNFGNEIGNLLTEIKFDD
jgi:hypothetical protein